MKKIFMFFSVMFAVVLLTACSDTTGNKTSSQKSFVEFEFGVSSKNEIKGDTNDFANISGTVTDGDFIHLIDYETGIVHGSAPVKDGYFELSTNMAGLDNQKLIFTNEEVDFPKVEDVSTIKQKVDLVFIANSATKNKSSEEKIEESEFIEEPQEEVAPKVFEAGIPISFSSADGVNIDVTINQVTKYEGDNYYVAKGVYFAKVDFILTNNGSSPFDISSRDFEFYDSKGFKSELIAKDYFSESVQSGKSIQGVGYYDVANDGESFEIYFADSSWIGTYK